MNAVWLVVKTDMTSCDKVLNAFSIMQDMKIEGRRDHEIILSVDTDDMHFLNQKIEEISGMEGVIAVYPVFSLDSVSNLI